MRSRSMMTAQSRFMSVKVGDKVPSALLSIVKHDGQTGFSSEIVDTAEYFSNKNVVIVGYPGAFTPTCMSTHIPEFIESAEKIKEQGAVDEIIALSVNDPFVVTAFAEKLGGKTLVSFAADGNGEFTKALGLDLDLSAVQLAHRTRRSSIIIKRDTIIELNDEQGAGLTEVSSAGRILEQLGKTK